MLSIVVGVSGCEIFSDSPEPEAIKSVVKHAVDNQVYVKGGTFELGDIGDETGRPYVTLTPHAKPAVNVALHSYSISRYETTWGEFRVYLEDVGHLDPYTEKVSTSKYIQSSEDPLSPHYHRKPARSPNYVEAEGGRSLTLRIPVKKTTMSTCRGLKSTLTPVYPCQGIC